MRGEWDSAREFSNRGMSLTSSGLAFLGLTAVLEHEAGNSSPGDAYLEQLLADLGKAPPEPSLRYLYVALRIPVVAQITGMTEHLATAKEAFEKVLLSPYATKLVEVTARAGLAMIALQTDDKAAAEEHYEALKPAKGLLIHTGTDRLLGGLAGRMGEIDKSVSHFEEAIAFYTEAKSRPELAWTFMEAAKALRQRGGSGDEEKATSMLERSTSIAAELGMVPLMERIGSLQASTEP